MCLLHPAGSQAHTIPLCFLSSRSQPFEASDLLLGLNFSKVLSNLVALNKVTAGQSAFKHSSWWCELHDCGYSSLHSTPSVWALSADSRSGVFICYSLCSDISVGSDSASGRHSSSHRNRSFESLSCQTSLGRSSKLLQNQFRSLVRSEFTVAPLTLSTNPTLSRINAASFWHLKGLSQPFVPGPNDPASDLGNLGLGSACGHCERCPAASR